MNIIELQDVKTSQTTVLNHRPSLKIIIQTAQKSKVQKHLIASVVNLYLGWKKQQIIGNTVP